MTNWIITASRDHVLRGVAGGFIQANHGRPHPVRAMARGDHVFCYSPRTEHPDGDRLQAFTALGRVADDESFQAELTPDFRPWRRRVDFEDCVQTPIRPLIEQLDFIEDKAHWGYRFRFGGFRVDDHDAGIIRAAMQPLDGSA
ncbi:EVE domain-containing protein [Mycolicibacterium vaccae]|uniref:EVE domain-containing protein n=1 Tax=Mycolicibacterium vaccae TaxID=1810 RepID=UPI003CF5E6EB